MKRVVLFAVLLVAFVVVTFPHELVVKRVLRGALGGSATRVEFANVSPSIRPLGYRLDDVVLSAPTATIKLDRIYLGLRPISGTVVVDAQACGGTLRGDLRDTDARLPSGAKERRLELLFTDLHLDRCLELSGLRIGGRFGGKLFLQGLGRGNVASLIGRTARGGTILVSARDGFVSGHLPGNGSAPGRPIGDWDFTSLEVDGKLVGGNLVVESADAVAGGVQWAASSASIKRTGARWNLAAEFRARRVDESTRGKAMLGLLPKAGEHEDGWRTYRLSGTAAAPKLIGFK